MKRFLILLCTLFICINASADNYFHVFWKIAHSNTGRVRPVFYLKWPDNFVGNTNDVRVYFNYRIEYSWGRAENGYMATIYGISGKYEHATWSDRDIVDVSVEVTGYNYKMKDYEGALFIPTESQSSSTTSGGNMRQSQHSAGPTYVDRTYTGVSERPVTITLDFLNGEWSIYADGKPTPPFDKITFKSHSLANIVYECDQTQVTKNGRSNMLSWDSTNCLLMMTPKINEEILSFSKIESYLSTRGSRKSHWIREYAYVLQRCGNELRGRRILIREKNVLKDADTGEVFEETEKNVEVEESVVLYKNR